MHYARIGGSNGNTVSDLIEVAVSFVAVTVGGSGAFNSFRIFLFTAFSALRRTHRHLIQIHIEHLVVNTHTHTYMYMYMYARSNNDV